MRVSRGTGTFPPAVPNTCMPVPPVPAPLVFSVRDQHLFQVRGELRGEKPACRNAGEPGTQRFLMCQGRFAPPVFLRAPEISGHFHPLLCGEREHKSRPSASDDPNGNETSQRICLMGSSPTCPPACGGDRQGTSSAVCGAVVCGVRCEWPSPAPPWKQRGSSSPNRIPVFSLVAASLCFPACTRALKPRLYLAPRPASLRRWAAFALPRLPSEDEATPRRDFGARPREAPPVPLGCGGQRAAGKRGEVLTGSPAAATGL